MEYLTLNNGIQMPLISFGTFMLDGEACRNAVTEALENGYRMIDTAEAYGNEKEVGKGIKQSGIDRRKLLFANYYGAWRTLEKPYKSVISSLNPGLKHNAEYQILPAAIAYIPNVPVPTSESHFPSIHSLQFPDMLSSFHATILL